MTLPVFTTAFAPPEQLQCRAFARASACERAPKRYAICSSKSCTANSPEKVLQGIEALANGTP